MTDVELQAIKARYFTFSPGAFMMADMYPRDILAVIADDEFLRLLIHDLREERGSSNPDGLTVEQVRAGVEQVRICTDDYDSEGAHQAEDRIWRTVMEAIANGKCESPALCAREVLKTIGIHFTRWYS